MPKPSKIKPAEYSEPVIEAPKEAAPVVSRSAFTVDQPAPRTLYVDTLTNEVTDKLPERSMVLIDQGDIVTELVARQAKGF